MAEGWFFPQRASTVAGEVDSLYLFMVALTAVISLGIAVAIVFFVLRYHRSRRDVDRSNPSTGNLALEITWSAIPLLIAIGIFIWASKVYLRL
jgi:cytochrome c oxidase subunit II